MQLMELEFLTCINMRIEVFGCEPEDAVEAWVRKFVLPSEGDEDVLVISRPGTPKGHEHKALLKANRALIGAGDI